MEVVNAWYGVQGSIEEGRGGQVTERLRQNVAQHGRLVLDGNLNNFFGFDPAPGVRKVAAIHVRIQGRDHHLRAAEGQHFHFPNVEVVNAWYGVQGSIEEGRGGQVTERLRQNVGHHGGGRLVLDGNLNNFFGFDPAPGVHKVAAIHVRIDGQDFHLRAAEGQPFHFP